MSPENLHIHNKMLYHKLDTAGNRIKSDHIITVITVHSLLF